MENVSGTRLNRKRFLQLGGAGIVGLAGGFGHPAYSQEVTTTGNVIADGGAVADGVHNDYPAIRKCLENYNSVYFPGYRSDGSRAVYAVNMSVDSWEPLRLGTGGVFGKKIQMHEAAKIVRRGGMSRSRVLFGLAVDADALRDGALNGIDINGLNIDGNKFQFNTLDIFEDVMTCFFLRGQEASKPSGLVLRNCRIWNWPGVSFAMSCMQGFSLRYNTVTRSHRGSLIMHRNNVGTESQHSEVHHNEVYNSGDDCIAINADGHVDAPVVDGQEPPRT